MSEWIKPTLPLPEIISGELLRQTQNFRVVADFKPGLEGKKEGQRFYIEPRTNAGLAMLYDGALAQNIYNFDLRPVEGLVEKGRTTFVPSLSADYSHDNYEVLFEGKVMIPKEGEDTVPSLGRMEMCIRRGRGLAFPKYTFADDLPENYGVTNLYARHLRLHQAIFLDDIPDFIVKSKDSNPYYKVRKAWWATIWHYLNSGLTSGEFKDPFVAKEVNSFIERFKRGDFGPEVPTTKENIDDVNKLIDTIWVASTKSAQLQEG